MADLSIRKHFPGSMHPLSGKMVPKSGVSAIVQTRATSINKRSLHQFADAVWRDYKATNATLVAKGARFAGGAMIGRKVFNYFEAVPAWKWALKRFGPLPYEYAGNIQWTELSAGARIGRVATATGATMALTFVAFETGVLIGSTINQLLPEHVQDEIGGTLNEIINEGGYKELWKHPFGLGR